MCDWITPLGSTDLDVECCISYLEKTELKTGILTKLENKFLLWDRLTFGNNFAKL